MAATPTHETRRPGASGIPGWMLALGGMVLLMAVANAVMVWQSTGSRRDLVRPDYYAEGLNEDEAIARNALAQAAGRVSLARTPSGWRVETEADVRRAGICRAHFYRPDDGREDR